MQFVVAFLKKIPILPVVLFIVGLAIGLVTGWEPFSSKMPPLITCAQI